MAYRAANISGYIYIYIRDIYNFKTLSTVFIRHRAVQREFIASDRTEIMINERKHNGKDGVTGAKDTIFSRSQEKRGRYRLSLRCDV